MRLRAKHQHLTGTVTLSGSKSISNRALLLCALADTDAAQLLSGLSDAADTVVMAKMLGQSDQVFDAHDAGTAFRFMCAYLAVREGKHTLTGSARMQERPVEPLVSALRQLGIEIQYLTKEGYPPIEIAGKRPETIQTEQISLPGHISSQFVSALLMIAPLLSNGLRIEVQPPRVSWSYAQMTIAMMQGWGVEVQTDGDALVVKSGHYRPKAIRVEPDWSAASYWCSMAALSATVDLFLPGLQMEKSVQGDAACVEIYRKLGLDFEQTEAGVRIRKAAEPKLPRVLSVDFTEIPDLAQTVAVTCAALGISGVFTGLETLAIKETDRVKALKTELTKIGVQFIKMPPSMTKKSARTTWMIDGKADLSSTPSIDTYQDHRMAMAFAPLAMLAEIEIHEPEVVRKSYPGFWADMDSITGSSSATDPI